MFIPFLVVSAVATTFGQLGAMAVQISFLTASLQAMTVAFLAASIMAIALFLRSRRQYPLWVPA